MHVPRSETPPWTEPEIDALMNLLHEIVHPPVPEPPYPRPPGGWTLKDMQLAPDATNADADWSRVQRDVLYRRLQRNSDFKDLRGSYRKFLESKPKVRRSAHSEFDFLFWALYFARLYHALEEQRHRTKGVRSLIRKKAVLKAVDTLQRQRALGLHMTDDNEDQQMELLLRRFHGQLTNAPRKKRETDKTPGTAALRGMAYRIAATYRRSSPSVIEKFAQWLGIQMNHTNIAKLSAAANKQHELNLRDLDLRQIRALPNYSRRMVLKHRK